jgi:anaerobic selenocysteine-containing dehydrogenase
LQAAAVDPDTGLITKDGSPIGVEIDGVALEGFHTPSRKLEFHSQTMIEWGWPEHAIPGYIKSHIGLTGSETATGEFCLLPTFRLPTLIHTRSGGAKWLNEISQRNPVWIHTSDARRMGVRTGQLVRVTTEIGYFVDRVWVTESIRPGVVACSHHLGRWRRAEDPPNSRWSGSVVRVEESEPGKWKMRRVTGPRPFDSDDPDSKRIWWREGGVPQNLTHAVHADPLSGMHCWHQRVHVEPAADEDRAGDVLVDTEKSMAVYREWLSKTRWPVGPGDLRRPKWLNRPLRPTDAAYHLPGKT